MPVSLNGKPGQAVLRRDIPWSTYMSARLLDDKNLQLIRKFDKKSDDTQDALLKEVGPRTRRLGPPAAAPLTDSGRRELHPHGGSGSESMKEPDWTGSQCHGLVVRPMGPH